MVIMVNRAVCMYSLMCGYIYIYMYSRFCVWKLKVKAPFLLKYHIIQYTTVSKYRSNRVRIASDLPSYIFFVTSRYFRSIEQEDSDICDIESYYREQVTKKNVVECMAIEPRKLMWWAPPAPARPTYTLSRRTAGLLLGRWRVRPNARTPSCRIVWWKSCTRYVLVTVLPYQVPAHFF